MRAQRRKVGDVTGSSDVGDASGNVRLALRAVMALAVSWAILFLPLHGSAQIEDEGEYRVKLAFLYNFAQFIEWPSEVFHDPAAPLTICVLGQNPFEGEIERDLRGRQAAGHPIKVVRLRRDEDPRACQMIFVRASENKAVLRMLPALSGSSTLTVGEAKGFASSGGVINLIHDDNKLRFEINLDAAAKTQIKISSKLLALARIVKQGQGP